MAFSSMYKYIKKWVVTYDKFKQHSVDFKMTTNEYKNIKRFIPPTINKLIEKEFKKREFITFLDIFNKLLVYDIPYLLNQRSKLSILLVK